MMMRVLVGLLLFSTVFAETPHADRMDAAAPECPDDEEDGVGLLQSRSQSTSNLEKGYRQDPEDAPREINDDSSFHDETPAAPDLNDLLAANLKEALAAEQNGPGYAGTCSANLTAALATCTQEEPEWCWATVASVIGGFFKPTQYKAQGDNCVAMECRIVGNKLNPWNPAYCCGDTMEECYGEGGSGSQSDFIEGIRFISDQDYLGFDGWPLEQKYLDEALSLGYPVGIGVIWLTGGGHMLTLGGCAGDGKYYLYDSLTPRGLWQVLSYSELLNYDPGDLQGNASYVFRESANTKKTLGELTGETSMAMYQSDNDTTANLTGGFWQYTVLLQTEATFKLAEWWSQQPGRKVFASTVAAVTSQ